MSSHTVKNIDEMEAIYRGADQLAKLASQRLTLCGAGALGSNLADNLARQGFRDLRVIDRDGNAVSNTYTLNFSYGLGLVAEGTGVLLNNELDDFTSKPGTANAYGLVGYDANLPGPGKRPLSSMTPTIVLKDGKPFLITGSPGGSRIITAVLQVIVNAIDFHMPIDQAVSAPRLHHQWQPDEVYVEPGFAPEVLEALAKRGHNVVPTPSYSSTNSIEITPDGYIGAADRRTRGSLAAGY